MKILAVPVDEPLPPFAAPAGDARASGTQSTAARDKDMAVRTAGVGTGIERPPGIGGLTSCGTPADRARSVSSVRELAVDLPDLTVEIIDAAGVLDDVRRDRPAVLPAGLCGNAGDCVALAPAAVTDHPLDLHVLRGVDHDDGV